MATSLIGGLINGGVVNASQITVFEPGAQKAQALKAEFSINIANNNSELVNKSDIVVIAVKPQVLQAVLEPLADDFKQQNPLIVSIAAGITAQSIEQWLGGEYAVVRVMPNTPALVTQGASGLYANAQVSQVQKEAATTLMNAVGVSGLG